MFVKKTIKRIALLLTLVMLFSALPFIAIQAQAAEEAPIPITSIEYVFTVTGVTDATSITLTVQGQNPWVERIPTINLIENGVQSVTVDLDGGVAGFQNLGFTTGLSGTGIAMTLNRVIVNDDIELAFANPPVLNSGNNGLPNIWNTTEGVTIASNSDESMRLALSGGLIRLLEPAEYIPGVPVATPIASIEYVFSIAGVAGESDIQFNLLDDNASWASLNLVVTLSGDGDYSVIANLGDGVGGLRNLGYAANLGGTNIAMTLTRLVINEDIELTFDTPPTLTAGANGLPNIWNAVDGEVIASSADETSWLAFTQAAGLIRFYTIADATGPIMRTSRSMDYIVSMGMGWNLGNTLDSVGGNNLIGWETSWGNPVTTRELIQSIADRGFDHIRIPFTIDNRMTDRGTATPDDELRFIIHPEWLARYREIVEWSLDAGLHVMVNIHHDSWIWMGRNNSWVGPQNEWRLRRFQDHWVQIAQLFADMPDEVSFETLNEPHFYNTGNRSEQEVLNIVNQAAFDIIRATPGNEQRVIVIPTIWTRHYPQYSRPVRDFIRGLNDENIIATVHFYSQWVFSTNLGKTMFDEILWGSETPRVHAREAFEILYTYFMSEGIGVNIGEWGLLAYDNGHDILQTGEELKYYEYMFHLAREFGANLTFWDNGSGIDRRSPDLTWRQPRMGAMIEASSKGYRSSYSAGLDTLYFHEPVASNVEIPLMLNGNTFVGIEGLTQGTHFTYSAGVVTLMMDYVNEMFNALADEYGVFAALVMQFSQGADWNQFLVRNSTPSHYFATGIRGGGNAGGTHIPIDLRGNHIRRISASQNGNRVGGSQSGWWAWLHNGEAFRIHYATNHLQLRPNFFSSSVQPGTVSLRVYMFDGQVMEIDLHVAGTGANTAVTVLAGPQIATTSLPDGTEGDEYLQTLAAQGRGTIVWSLEAGDLPNGLTLSEDGTIYGMPTASGLFTFIVKATHDYGYSTRVLSIKIIPISPVLTFDIFNNGEGGSPSRPNASLAAAGTIRMWTQLDGVNTRVYLATADTIEAFDQDGNCAMAFLTVPEMWQPGAFLPYFNRIDVDKNQPWQYINFSITAYGRLVELVLINALFEEPQLPVLTFDIFNNGKGGSPSRPNPSLAAAGTIRMWTQLNGVNTRVYLAAADTIEALDQDGNCAMAFLTVPEMWQPGGFLPYFNRIDVDKNQPWQYIHFSITAYGRLVELVLVNSNYVPAGSSHTVTFTVEVGAVGVYLAPGATTTVEMPHGEAIPAGSIPSPIARVGFYFAGWAPIAPSEHGNVYGNVSFTARFNPLFHYVTFEAGYGGVPMPANPLRVRDGFGIPAGSVPYPEALPGFVFVGWVLEGEAVDPAGFIVRDNITITAVFEAEE